MAKWFRAGTVNGTPLIRYAVVTRAGIEYQISKPDGEEIDPIHMHKRARKKPADVTPKFVDVQQMRVGNGEQPRRPTWRRAGRRVEGGTT